MATTLQDIARLTKTSKSTVSRFLNGGSVSVEKAKRIQAAIQELDYQPNVNAKRLVQSKAKAIAVVFDDISDYIYGDMMAGLHEVAAQNHLSCLYLSRAQGAQETDFFQLLSSGMADGLIFVTFRKRSKNVVQALQRSGKPVVLIGDAQGVPGVCAVDVDNHAGTRLQVEHLIQKGHRQIAYLKGPDAMPAAAERLRGYQDTLHAAGIPFNANFVRKTQWNAEDAYKSATSLLEHRQFTALIASNAYSAYGALMALKDAGMAVPEDVALVGFDEAPILNLARPPITTIRQPIRTLGEIAVQKLIARIDNPNLEGRLTRVQPELILRASTAD